MKEARIVQADQENYIHVKKLLLDTSWLFYASKNQALIFHVQLILI